VGRGRGGVRAALSTLQLPTLVLGIPSDRLFTLEGQDEIARHTPGSLDGDRATRIDSPFGHDAFLIEFERVGEHLRRLLKV
jgi:homoserine O-acetyltransferase